MGNSLAVLMLHPMGSHHKYILLLICMFLVSCKEKPKIDLETSFLTYSNKTIDSSLRFSDKLTEAQKRTADEFKISVQVPKDFKVLKNIEDTACFVFYDSLQKSIIMAKCFTMTDSIWSQMQKSTKYDSPIYGSDYNDLSEFKHYKKCEKMVSDSAIGPFLFGGAFYDLLGADYVMHQWFQPNTKLYEHGEFQILIDKEKYMFVCWMHNGYSESYSNEGPEINMVWQTFVFNRGFDNN